MSEELIKRLRTVARDEERAWGAEDEVVILLREAADALSRPAAPSVDAQKVIGLVEDYGDAMFAAGISCGHHEHRHEREYRDDADEAKAKIRALLSAPPAASGWQLIETAPKDGTRILLAKIGATNAVPGLGIKAREPHVWWACTGHWSEKWKNWNDGIEPCGLAGPNYWHPLPPPPAIANQEAQE